MRRAGFASLLLAVALSGCARIEEAALPVTAKINAAYPVGPELRIAHEQLLALAGDDKKAADSIKAAIAARMDKRALTCANHAQIGRFESVAAVRERGFDRLCFKAQDIQLHNFYGVRAVGLLLGRPALRPLRPLGPMAPLPRGKMTDFGYAQIARDANVGVLVSNSGNGAVIEVPGGAPIAELPNVRPIETHASSLSPNGRVLMLSTGERALFFDAESGQQIWSWDTGSRPKLLGWLPEFASVVLRGSDGHMMLADGVTGAFARHPLSLQHSMVGTHLPGAGGRLLFGHQLQLMLVEHARTAEGLTASPLKRFALPEDRAVMTERLLPMRDGRLVVFGTGRHDIGWLDLESGESGSWHHTPLFGSGSAKLDEHRLLLYASANERQHAWAFDIDTGMVAPLDLPIISGGSYSIGDRAGIMRGDRQTLLGDAFNAGAAQPLAKLVADYELEQQLAKMEPAVAAQHRQALSAQVQGSATGAPAPVAAAAPAAMPSAAPAATVPGLERVPADAEVHIVGVYEGKGEARKSSEGKEAREVRVNVVGTGRPVVLVLSSYEPVNWRIVGQGARVAAVLLSGYYQSTVSGTGRVVTLSIGREYAYEPRTAEYGKLMRAVVQYTGTRPLSSFQGRYAGAEFIVGTP